MTSSYPSAIVSIWLYVSIVLDRIDYMILKPLITPPLNDDFVVAGALRLLVSKRRIHRVCNSSPLASSNPDVGIISARPGVEKMRMLLMAAVELHMRSRRSCRDPEV